MKSRKEWGDEENGVWFNDFSWPSLTLIMVEVDYAKVFYKLFGAVDAVKALADVVKMAYICSA